jgi:hypothetical protein
MAETASAERPGDHQGPRRNEGVAMNAALGIDRQSFADALSDVGNNALSRPMALLRTGAQLQSVVSHLAWR